MEDAMHDLSKTDPIERLARRRAGVKLGLYIHAAVYLVVNLGLLVLDSRSAGARWAWYPMLGWGLGLAIHAAIVTLALPGGGLFEALLAREREALRARDRRGGLS
jgi:hypothetical protein